MVSQHSKMTVGFINFVLGSAFTSCCDSRFMRHKIPFVLVGKFISKPRNAWNTNWFHITFQIDMQIHIHSFALDVVSIYLKTLQSVCGQFFQYIIYDKFGCVCNRFGVIGGRGILFMTSWKWSIYFPWKCPKMWRIKTCCQLHISRKFSME